MNIEPSEIDRLLELLYSCRMLEHASIFIFFDVYQGHGKSRTVSEFFVRAN